MGVLDKQPQALERSGKGPESLYLALVLLGIRRGRAAWVLEKQLAECWILRGTLGSQASPAFSPPQLLIASPTQASTERVGVRGIVARASQPVSALCS